MHLSMECLQRFWGFPTGLGPLVLSSNILLDTRLYVKYGQRIATSEVPLLWELYGNDVPTHGCI